MIKDQFYSHIQALQNIIIQGLEDIDGKGKFKEDLWNRSEGGGGRTCIIENGAIFEKGGVNVSKVFGTLPSVLKSTINAPDAVTFFACGLSLVIHPKNPFVPTVHANWRYFEMYDSDGQVIDCWFGGGQDLTPYYLFEEDATHFHQVCKKACDKHHPDFYTNYKKQCDTYFWNAHRNEARGIGGLFFDHCRPTDNFSIDQWFEFVKEISNQFLECYIPIVSGRKDLKNTAEHRQWQEIRRGRYVEFNLIYDKGTTFGLKSNGRIESILMSLPAHVQWVYNHHPTSGSEEEKLVKVLETPREWVLKNIISK